MPDDTFNISGYPHKVTAFGSFSQANTAVNEAYGNEGEDGFNAWVEKAPAGAPGSHVVACRKAPAYELYYL